VVYWVQILLNIPWWLRIFFTCPIQAFFLISILWSSHVGDQTQVELAKFGYREERKVEKFKNPAIVWRPAGAYMVTSKKILEKTRCSHAMYRHIGQRCEFMYVIKIHDVCLSVWVPCTVLYPYLGAPQHTARRQIPPPSSTVRRPFWGWQCSPAVLPQGLT
jgi:hypothetical protein